MILKRFDSRYLPQIITFLNEALPAHTITAELFSRKVLLDPDFDPELCLLALNDNALVGCVVAILPTAAVSAEQRGYITLFAVDNALQGTGIGTALFDAAEEGLRQRGADAAWISPYAPGYWTPGVDEETYADALLFLSRRGYHVVSRPIGMSVSLDLDWAGPAWAAAQVQALHDSHGLDLSEFRPELALDLAAFLATEFPGDWQRQIRQSMLDVLYGFRPPGDIIIAHAGQDVWGFAHAQCERFGPIGVAGSRRNLGVGNCLMSCMLRSMSLRGAKRAWFMWTGEETAKRFYAPMGFRQTQRYSICTKNL